ncbi:MAG TPA: hypothetical protein VHO93_04045 [Actinomycetota bacterium]|jgi:hypothetical protein|nr:hypothetical protein [Actinomycetota bacterium]
MGRRSRARERAAASMTARSEPAAPAPGQGRRSWTRLLNPFRFRRLTRTRARAGAAGFGLAAVLFAVVGWLSGRPAWFSSAVMLAILALAWGVSSAFLGEGDRSS